MDNEESYRNKIISMVKKIKSTDILLYLYTITNDIVKEDKK